MARFLAAILCGGVTLVATTSARTLCQRGETRTFEAEDAILSKGVVVDTAQSGFSGMYLDLRFWHPASPRFDRLGRLNVVIGTGYVTGFDEGSDKVTFNISSDSTRLYDLTIRVGAIYGEKRTSVILNGGASSEVYFPASQTFANVAGGQLLLEAGANTLDIVSNWGWYLLDSITLTPSAPRAAHNIDTTLRNAAADDNAKALYAYLRSIYGKKILSGQQELSYADWISRLTGKTPALVSVDLIDYSPSRVERGTVGTAVEEALVHHNRGGIVSVLWHWNAPAGLYDTDENKWWSGFYTRATDFDLEAALSTTTNSNYTLIL